MKFLMKSISLLLVLSQKFIRTAHPSSTLHSSDLHRQWRRSHSPSLPHYATGLVLISSAILIGSLGPASCYAAQTEEFTPVYVGSEACKPCHEKEYASFIQYAKKSKSYQSIERLEKGLSKEDLTRCYGCHTTGYGRPGGFVSIEETPQLKNAGCEVCHGPGEKHVKDENIDSVKRKPTREDCEICHTSERVKAFRYKPLIHGGGH